MVTTADVIIIGLGVHGSASAASLARRGKRVVAIEQFGERHTRGSSHGRTRMIRRAYPNPVWNDFVAQAYDAWGALERETGHTLFHRTGGLYAHRGESQLQSPRSEVVHDPARMAELMPALRVPAGYGAVYDPDAGVLEAEYALGALRSVARRHGAELRFDEPVIGWDSTAHGVEVRTATGIFRAPRIVVSVGSWAAQTFSQLAPLLEVWRILTLSVAPGQRAGMPPQLGAFSIDRPEGLMFGIPDAAGNGLKIGVDASDVWDPNVPVAPPRADEIAMMRDLMATRVPGIDTTPAEATACLYTMTEDKRFIIGPLADAPDVVVVSACSGHGFKFGGAVGNAVADIVEGTPREDLDFISTSRRGI
nr:N-methyl-L-tryptophan oxidase [Microbacterium endophyticum]